MAKKAYMRGKAENDEVIGVAYGGTGKSFLRSLEERKLSPASIVAFRGALLDLFFFLSGAGMERLQDITLEVLEKYRLNLVERKLSGATVKHYLRVVKCFFRHLERTGGLFSDPSADLANPNPVENLLDAPTEEDMEKLLAAIDVSTPSGIRDRAVVETLYSTGMRIGELLGMSVLDADVGNRTVRVSGKGGKERIVPMGRHAAFWLGKYLSSARKEHFRDDGGSIRENRLWVNTLGGRLDRNAVGTMLSGRCRTAGIRRTGPHAIRRACATHMLRNGAHPVQLQMLLGHADLRTLGHYLRLTINDIKDMHKRSRPGR